MKNIINNFKNLTISKRRTSGRNANGKIVSHHRAGGFKRRYRCIDFMRDLYIPAIVKRFEFDPNRNASIALICYYNEVLSYITLPKNLNIGDIVYSHPTQAYINSGNASRLGAFPAGTFVHNVELLPYQGGRYARAGGCSAQILKKYNDNFVAVKFKTTEQRLISTNCRATVGTPIQLFKNYRFINYKSAGHARRFGYRPVTRGVAMNPVDHPHGGAGGRLDRSPWGWLTKGPRTSKMRINWLVLHTRRSLARRKIKN